MKSRDGKQLCKRCSKHYERYSKGYCQYCYKNERKSTKTAPSEASSETQTETAKESDSQEDLQE